MIFLVLYVLVLVALLFYATRNPVGALFGFVGALYAMIFLITRG